MLAGQTVSSRAWIHHEKAFLQSVKAAPAPNMVKSIVFITVNKSTYALKAANGLV